MMRKLVVATVLALVGAVACNKEAPPVAAKGAPSATMEDGKQVVRVAVMDTGYQPKQVELRAGVPARVLFKQESKNECGAQVQVPSQGIAPTALPFGKETAIEFTPPAPGEITFTCGMNMMKGTFVVKP